MNAQTQTEGIEAGMDEYVDTELDAMMVELLGYTLDEMAEIVEQVQEALAKMKQ